MNIWKFAIGVGTGPQHLAMPAGARLLSVQLQEGLPQLWALCDPGAPQVLRRIEAFGTGDEVTAETGSTLAFVATVQMGPAVLHYFDRGERAR